MGLSDQFHVPVALPSRKEHLVATEYEARQALERSLLHDIVQYINT